MILRIRSIFSFWRIKRRQDRSEKGGNLQRQGGNHPGDGFSGLSRTGKADPRRTAGVLKDGKRGTEALAAFAVGHSGQGVEPEAPRTRRSAGFDGLDLSGFDFCSLAFENCSFMAKRWTAHTSPKRSIVISARRRASRHISLRSTAAGLQTPNSAKPTSAAILMAATSPRPGSITASFREFLGLSRDEAAIRPRASVYEGRPARLRVRNSTSRSTVRTSTKPDLADFAFKGCHLKDAREFRKYTEQPRTCFQWPQTCVTATSQMLLLPARPGQSRPHWGNARRGRFDECQPAGCNDQAQRAHAAQTVLLNCQQSAVTYRSQQMVASVQLIKALGGGWDITRLPAEKALGMKISVDDRARH